MHTNGHETYTNGASRPNIVARVEREPPHNVEAERALLGALLVGGNDVLAAVRDRIDAADMFNPLHAHLWEVMVDRLGAGKRVTPNLLQGCTADQRRYAVGLVADATTTINAAAYADIVRDLACRRRFIAIAQQGIDDAHKEGQPLPEVLRATAGDIALVQGAVVVDDRAPVMARRMSDVAVVPIRWLWKQRFALGKLAIVAGEPGVGKSQLSCAFTAAVTNGGGWPDGTRAPAGSVIIIGCEDDAADTIRPRLEAAGANLRSVHILDWVVEATHDRAHFDVGAHVAALAALARQIGDVRLIIIDPISAYMGGADSHVVAEVRQALSPLQAMAAELGIAVLMISHLNKSSAAGGAMARVSGSGAFVAVARSAWLVGIDPQDSTKGRRILTPLKNNLGDDRTGFSYHVEPWADGNIATSRVVWDAGTVEISPDDLLQKPPGTSGDDGASVLAEAEAFLRAELAEGPKPSTWVEKAARDAGISVRTLKRARSSLGIVPRKDGAGRWHIHLPPSMTRDH